MVRSYARLLVLVIAVAFPASACGAEEEPLAASTTYRQIARNDMGEHIKAAPAASDGQLFLRTYKTLYCLGERKQTKRD